MELVVEKYKKTELGLIPSDWEVKTLGELGKFSKGSGVRKDEALSGDIPCIRYGELYTRHSDYIKQFYSFISKDIAITAKKLKAGDILFAGSGETKEEIGKSVAFVNDFEAYAGGDIVILSPTTAGTLYLGYLLNAPFIQKQKASRGQGDAVVHISATQLGNIKIPLPPTLTEQTLIATVLSDADALISSLEKLIAKKRNIKQGAMQKLLQPKEGWEVKKLGEVADITKLAGFEYTNYFNSYNDGGEIIVVRGTNITHNKMDLTDTKYIPRTTSNFLQRSKLKKNDLVFAYVGTIGPIFLIDENDRYHLGPNTSKITSGSNLYPVFLFHYFTSKLLKKEIIDNTSIGAQPSLSMFKIRSFKIVLPPIMEQTHIAIILSDIDNEITALETKLEKYKKVKLGMMQNLLTGKIRLV